jgi:hypothetical protein
MSTYCQSCSEPVKTPGVCKSCAVTLRKEVALATRPASTPLSGVHWYSSTKQLLMRWHS